MGVGRFNVYSGGGGGDVMGSLGTKIVCRTTGVGAWQGEAVALGLGLGCHVYHRRVDVPRSLGGEGMH